MCQHYWKIGAIRDMEAPGTCAYCGETRMFDATFPPKRYNFRKPWPEKHKPKMSQTDRDIGGMFEGLPRVQRM